MLRVTEIKLPLDHGPEALKNALVKKLRVAPHEVTGFSVFKRAHDARRKNAIAFIYSVDVSVHNEAQVLKHGDPHIRPAPDMEYRFVAQAPETFKRPVVIGAGPCGLFAALILAQ